MHCLHGRRWGEGGGHYMTTVHRLSGGTMDPVLAQSQSNETQTKSKQQFHQDLNNKDHSELCLLDHRF